MSNQDPGYLIWTSYKIFPFLRVYDMMFIDLPVIRKEKPAVLMENPYDIMTKFVRSGMSAPAGEYCNFVRGISCFYLPVM